MSTHSVVCTARGYEVTLASDVAIGALLEQLYGSKGKTHASTFVPGILRSNPGVARQVQYLESVLPRGTRLLLPLPPDPNNGMRDIPDLDQNAVRRAILDVQRHVDTIPPLRGSGIVLILPGTEPLALRPAGRRDDLQTWVKLAVEVPSSLRSEERTWWKKWGDSVISCGAAGFAFGATALACGTTPISGGLSAPLCVASIVGTGASVGQCGLAVGKATFNDFEEYLETEDGQWINYVDIGLDLLSLGVGVASIPNALKATSKVHTLSKYSRHLARVEKGKLIKTMERLEKLFEEMPELRKMFEKGLTLANPSRKAQLTNNIIKRMLPQVRYDLNRRVVENLAALIGTALSAVGSSRGGVGSESWGLLKFIKIEVYQFIDAEASG